MSFESVNVWSVPLYFCPLYITPTMMCNQLQDPKLGSQDLENKIEELQNSLEKTQKSRKLNKIWEICPNERSFEQKKQFLENSLEQFSQKVISPRKKWENTNKNKNIFPNTINRMISFLSCKARSSSVLVKFLQNNPHISKNCTVKTYFSYIKHIKSKMNRCLMKETIEKLFEYCDPKFQIFTQQQQQCFFRINIFLFSYYSKSPLHILYLVHSNCLLKENIPDYIKADRQILKRVNQIFSESTIKKKIQQIPSRNQ